MSEEKQSTMGPRRLFILLALGAGVFYFLSSGDTENEKTEKIVDNTEEVSDEDLLNSSNESDESDNPKKSNLKQILRNLTIRIVVKKTLLKQMLKY